MPAAPSPARALKFIPSGGPFGEVVVDEDRLAAHAAFVAGVGAGDLAVAARASIVVAAQLPALWGVILDPARGLSFMRVSHVAHDVEFSAGLAQLKAADIVSTTASVDDVRDGPTGDLITIALVTAGPGGAPIASTRCTLLRREPRRRGDDLTATPPTLAAGSTTTTTLPTTLALSEAWAAASGDGNPVFVDDEAAILAGLPGPIFGTAPVFVMALLAAGLPRRLSLTLRRPVVVGDDVIVRCDGAGIVVDVAAGDAVESAVAFGSISPDAVGGLR